MVWPPEAAHRLIGLNFSERPIPKPETLTSFKFFHLAKGIVSQFVSQTVSQFANQSASLDCVFLHVFQSIADHRDQWAAALDLIQSIRAFIPKLVSAGAIGRPWLDLLWPCPSRFCLSP